MHQNPSCTQQLEITFKYSRFRIYFHRTPFDGYGAKPFHEALSDILHNFNGIPSPTDRAGITVIYIANTWKGRKLRKTVNSHMKELVEKFGLRRIDCITVILPSVNQEKIAKVRENKEFARKLLKRTRSFQFEMWPQDREMTSKVLWAHCHIRSPEVRDLEDARQDLIEKERKDKIENAKRRACYISASVLATGAGVAAACAAPHNAAVLLPAMIAGVAPCLATMLSDKYKDMKADSQRLHETMIAAQATLRTADRATFQARPYVLQEKVPACRAFPKTDRPSVQYSNKRMPTSPTGAKQYDYPTEPQGQGSVHRLSRLQPFENSANTQESHFKFPYHCSRAAPISICHILFNGRRFFIIGRIVFCFVYCFIVNLLSMYSVTFKFQFLYFVQRMW